VSAYGALTSPLYSQRTTVLPISLFGGHVLAQNKSGTWTENTLQQDSKLVRWRSRHGFVCVFPGFTLDKARQRASVLSKANKQVQAEGDGCTKTIHVGPKRRIYWNLIPWNLIPLSLALFFCYIVRPKKKELQATIPPGKGDFCSFSLSPSTFFVPVCFRET